MKKRGLVRATCPISDGSCKFCVLYRGRHYYAGNACHDYLRRLGEVSGRVGGVTYAEGSKRKTCANWDKEKGCLECYPKECIVREECRKEAKSLPSIV